MKRSSKTKETNKWIESWQKTMKRFIKAYKKQGLKDYEVKDQIKRMANDQIYYIEEARPNKELTAEQQYDEKQKEFIEYARKVAQTGEL